jgi:hypothetical protein
VAQPWSGILVDHRKRLITTVLAGRIHDSSSKEHTEDKRLET